MTTLENRVELDILHGFASLGRKKDDAFIAFMQFKMPSVSIDAGPPVIVR